MAGYDISVGKDLLPGLLGNQDGLAKLVETGLKRLRPNQAWVSDITPWHQPKAGFIWLAYCQRACMPDIVVIARVCVAEKTKMAFSPLWPHLGVSALRFDAAS